jgi:hypothetical protein
MDDEDVAACSSRDALADTAAEQPVEEARLACTDHDQVGVALLGDLDDLRRGSSDDSGELVRDARLGEERLDPLAVALPELLVRLHAELGVAEVIRGEPEATGHRLERSRCGDVGDHHARPEGLRKLGGARQRTLRRSGAVVADDDRLHRQWPRSAWMSSHLPISFISLVEEHVSEPADEKPDAVSPGATRGAVRHDAALERR